MALARLESLQDLVVRPQLVEAGLQLVRPLDGCLHRGPLGQLTDEHLERLQLLRLAHAVVVGASREARQRGSDRVRALARFLHGLVRVSLDGLVLPAVVFEPPHTPFAEEQSALQVTVVHEVGHTRQVRR